MKTETKTRVRTAVRAKAQPRVAAKFYAFVDGARPQSGARLYAHTHAALTFLGLLEGRTAMVKALRTLIGEHAASYHAGRKNLAVSGEHVKLTAKGVKSFTARADTGKFPEDMANAFLKAISSGSPSAEFDIRKEHLDPVKGVPTH